MSASREKARRHAEREEGIEKRQVQKKKKYLEKRKANILKGVIGGIAALLVVLIIFVNSGFVYRYMTAVRVGDRTFSAADFNFYYQTAYYNYYYTIYSYYGDYASYFLPDSSTSFSSQEYSDDMTWADFFEDEALELMQVTVMLSAQAEEAGYTLSEDGQADIEEAISTYNTEYSSYGYSSAKAFYEGVYGKGVNEDIYRENLEEYTLANEYANIVYDSLEYTDDELDDYYEDYADTYDYITYRYYYIDGSEVEEDEENGIEGIDSETAMANAKAMADDMAASATSESIFADYAYDLADDDDKETYEDEDATLHTTQGQSISTTYSDWLLDDDRVEGETTVIEGSSGYYVLMFLSRNDNSYQTVNVRHILITAEADDDGEYTDEALEAALESIEEIYEEWLEGDATEESFAELANTYSDDTGSNTTGGLYENVYQDEMVDEFNDWCFDEDREVGDVGIVYGSSSSYAGYHLIYFSGYDMVYSRYIADSLMRSEDYTDWEEQQASYYTVSTKFALRFATK